MSPASASEADIRKWCAEYLAHLLDISPDKIGRDVKFARLGLDSANAVHLVLALEERLGIELDPEIIADYPTVAALAHEVAKRRGGGTTRS